MLLTVTLFTSTINTDIFLRWIEKDLINKIPKNTVFVMDNASFHKSTKIKLILEQNGHTLEFLPPYSPDLNPIEQTFALIKRKRQILNQSVEDIVLCNY